MRFSTIALSALFAVSAAGCHKDTRRETGNTGDNNQPAPTGDRQQVGTAPTTATGTGTAGATVATPPDQSSGSTGYGPAPGTTASATGNPMNAGLGSAAGSGSGSGSGSAAKRAQAVTPNRAPSGPDRSAIRPPANATDRGKGTTE